MEPDDSVEATDEVVLDDDRSRSDDSRVEREGVEPTGHGAGAAITSVRHPTPPVVLPSTINQRGPNNSVRSLQVGLRDLGFYDGKIDGYYTQPVRNAVANLQVALIEHGYYSGRPNGVYGKMVHTAAVADPAFDIT
jgi:peptidoglycan hydrolase-like protein with peptidoglycan-binding domain